MKQNPHILAIPNTGSFINRFRLMDMISISYCFPTFPASRLTDRTWRWSTTSETRRTPRSIRICRPSVSIRIATYKHSSLYCFFNPKIQALYPLNCLQILPFQRLPMSKNSNEEMARISSELLKVSQINFVKKMHFRIAYNRNRN
jgi:hypothetical protein